MPRSDPVVVLLGVIVLLGCLAALRLPVGEADVLALLLVWVIVKVKHRSRRWR